MVWVRAIFDKRIRHAKSDSSLFFCAKIAQENVEKIARTPTIYPKWNSKCVSLCCSDLTFKIEGIIDICLFIACHRGTSRNVDSCRYNLQTLKL